MDRMTLLSLASIAAVALAGPVAAQTGRPPMQPRTSTPESTGPKIGQPVANAGDTILAKSAYYSLYAWQVGMQPVFGPPAATHFCLLTKVSGKFAGAGERIALYIDTGATGGPRWMLNGTSGQSQLSAEATCIAKDQFVLAKLGSKLDARGYGNHMTGSCAPHIVSMDQPTKSNAFFISGMSGKFQGGGESVSVTNVLWNGAIRVTGCSGNADGTLMSVGDPDAAKTLFRTQSARVPLGGAGVDFTLTDKGPAGSSWGSGADLKAGHAAANLVPSNEAICGFTSISGKFQGYGESVALTRSNGFWRMDVLESGEDAQLAATARCFARDQR